MFYKRAYFPEGLLSRKGLLFSIYGKYKQWIIQIDISSSGFFQTFLY